MSKYLVKILSICALVVMIPLIILGTALCVTETVNYKIRLFVDGNDAQYTNCEVLVNGEKKDNNEFTFVKNSEVVISFVGEGFNFDGWYQGSDTTYQAENKVVSEGASFTLKVTENVDFTAKCAVKKYQVTYTGTYNDGSQLASDVYETVNYEYGESLKTIKPKETDEYIMFAGWSVVGEDDITTAKPYKAAKFAEDGDYTVKAAWRDLKEETYNLNVKFNAMSEQSQTITYNIIDGFSAYDVQREYYDFVGLEYNGTLYTYNSETKDYLSENISLGKVLIEDYELNVDVVAVWKAQYEKLTLNISGRYIDSYTGDRYVYGKKDGDNNYYRISFNPEYTVKDAEGCIALEQQIKDLVLTGYTSFYINDGGQYKEVELTDLRYYYSNVDDPSDSYSEATLAEMIDDLLDYDFDMTKTIIVIFIFTIK